MVLDRAFAGRLPMNIRNLLLTRNSVVVQNALANRIASRERRERHAELRKLRLNATKSGFPPSVLHKKDAT